MFPVAEQTGAQQTSELHAPRQVALQIQLGAAGRSDHVTMHPSREKGALCTFLAEHR